MQVQVTQTFVFVTTIEVPDEIAMDKRKLRDYWYKNPVELKSLDELDWLGTDFADPETDDELGDV